MGLLSFTVECIVVPVIHYSYLASWYFLLMVCTSELGCSRVLQDLMTNSSLIIGAIPLYMYITIV